MLRHGLIDELFLTIAPKIYAGPPTYQIVEGDLFPPDMLEPELISVTAVENEVFLRYRLHYHLQSADT